MKTADLSPLAPERAAQLLKALADPIRLRLMNLLAGGREVCVCHLHEALGLPQPTVSRHLAYLRRHGLVAARREGAWAYYRQARPGSSLHRALLVGLDACLADDPAFRDDRERLDRRSCCDNP